jgi:hypothetical protein
VINNNSLLTFRSSERLAAAEIELHSPPVVTVAAGTRSLQFEFFPCLGTVRTSLPYRRMILFLQFLPPPFSPHFFAVARFRPPAVTCCNRAAGLSVNGGFFRVA